MDVETRAAAYCVIVAEGRVLLTHWQRGRRWTLPGGGMEIAENTEQTAIRECREETGLDVRIDRLLGVDTNYIAAGERFASSSAGPLRGVRIIYAATVVGGTLTVEQDGSSDAVDWFQLDGLPERVELVDAALCLWRNSA